MLYILLKPSTNVQVVALSFSIELKKRKNLNKVGTKDNPADLETKALLRPTLETQLSLNRIQELKIDLDKVPVGQVKKAGRETATMTIAGLEKCGMCVDAEELQFLQRILYIKKLMGNEWPKGMSGCE